MTVAKTEFFQSSVPPDVKLQPNTFQATSGLWLNFYKWDVENSKAILYIIHGFGEHAGRYENFAKFLNKHQISVFALDLEGHGKSQGTRAHLEYFQNYVNEFFEFRIHIQKLMKNESKEYLNNLPQFLFSHSAGTITGYHVVRQSEVLGINWKGVILSSPAYDPEADTRLNRILAKVFGSLIPKLGIERINSAYVSRIPAMVQAYDNDPLNYHGKIMVRWGYEMMKATDLMKATRSTFTLPVLLIHGTADRISQPCGSQNFYNCIASTDKTLKWYDGGFHELLNDLCAEQVMNDVTNWIQDHISPE